MLCHIVSQEIDQLKRVNSRKEEEMLQRHALEKKRLPRIQKSEMKTRAQLYKQSLRISQIGPPENDRDKIRKVRRHLVVELLRFVMATLIFHSLN